MPGLLIVALAVTNPNYKIPDADECEQRSENPQKPNSAPLAEHAVENQIRPTKQRDMSLPKDVPILESRDRPEKGVHKLTVPTSVSSRTPREYTSQGFVCSPV